MSILSEYRASIQRIIAADNVDDAFRQEGYGEAASKMVQRNKSFKATRSLRQTDTPPATDTPVDKMPQGQAD
jgi:hypothetical protein